MPFILLPSSPSRSRKKPPPGFRPVTAVTVVTIVNDSQYKVSLAAPSLALVHLEAGDEVTVLHSTGAHTAGTGKLHPQNCFRGGVT